MAGDDLVAIVRFMHSYEAEIAKGVLDAAGIEAFIPDQTIGSVAPHFSYGTGGVRLLVREGDAERALAVLAAAPEEGDPGSTPEDARPPIEGLDDGTPRPSGVSLILRKSHAKGRYWLAPIFFGGLFGILFGGAYLWRVDRDRIPDGYASCESSWVEKRLDDVLDRCGELTRVSPHAAAGWAFLSQALTAKGRHEEAIAAGRRAASGGTVGWCYLALALHAAGRVDEAVGAVGQMKAIDPNLACDVEALLACPKAAADSSDDGVQSQDDRR